MSGMEPWFLRFSGEHPSLPKAEAFAILDSERYPAVILEGFPRALRIDTTPEGGVALAYRAGYVKYCCKELFKCKAARTDIAKAVKDVRFDELLLCGESFRVLVEKVECRDLGSVKELEEELGKEILDSAGGARVDLLNPDRTFFGLCVDGSFLFGAAEGGVGSRISERRPSLRPFFHPSAMLPKLARCMVNLARARASGSVFDPFCGTGSLLIEAGLIGCVTFGLDVSQRMVHGAGQNLRFFGIRDCGLIVGDARHLPVRAFDSVASDPPYGRNSSTHGANARQLVEVFLSEALGVLPSGGHLCLAFPKGQELSKLGEELGYLTVEIHEIREHKSLTREIVVFRKP